MAKKDEEIGYAEALAELEKILAELERADVDVDVLAARVQRASELIRLCRDRIGTARSRIEDVVGGLDG
ncbi:MAG: exodeoxyribonuclease VII small subunit [Acidimicrobiia bacterium]|nr:exodeoxyribonuclease VII small subunit [Actinomycetota bacterium]NDB05341.1 exodeoxyribonuclease VII small subunit [Acidimicrobiia bacterium]NDA77225.1 exodeoxyribonuclease VII small subunit [Actinomycetota bacterium]NDD96420.1 exodeoxyribonuclease VII small subunit [Actinomycetota bacterium]NDE81635.1 exodeoxyribonuclease VII small subunit [Actinomycetota bacterium]